MISYTLLAYWMVYKVKGSCQSSDQHSILELVPLTGLSWLHIKLLWENTHRIKLLHNHLSATHEMIWPPLLNRDLPKKWYYIK